MAIAGLESIFPLPPPQGCRGGLGAEQGNAKVTERCRRCCLLLPPRSPPLTLCCSLSLPSVPCKPGDAPHLAALARSNGIFFSTTSRRRAALRARESPARAQPSSEEPGTEPGLEAPHGPPEPTGDQPGAAGPSRDLPLLPSTRYFQDVSWGLLS